MRFIKVTDGEENIFINAGHIISVEAYFNAERLDPERTLITVTGHYNHVVDQSLTEVMSQLEGVSL
jgi:hypothetical protein